MSDHAVAYRDLRARVGELVTSVDPAALRQVAPATPEWRVHDVLAHLVGVCGDVVGGNLEGVTTEPWTAAHVDPRRDLPVVELLAEWESYGPRFEAFLDSGLGGQALYDAATHEHDMRHALGRPGARDSAALAFGWDWYVPVRGAAGNPVRFVSEGGEHVAGDGEPLATISASRFELFRAVTGRRTAAEIGAYGWDVEPDPALVVVGPMFSIRTDSLGE